MSATLEAAPPGRLSILSPHYLASAGALLKQGVGLITSGEAFRGVGTTLTGHGYNALPEVARPVANAIGAFGSDFYATGSALARNPGTLSDMASAVWQGFGPYALQRYGQVAGNMIPGASAFWAGIGGIQLNAAAHVTNIPWWVYRTAVYSSLGLLAIPSEPLMYLVAGAWTGTVRAAGHPNYVVPANYHPSVANHMRLASWGLTLNLVPLGNMLGMGIAGTLGSLAGLPVDPYNMMMVTGVMGFMGTLGDATVGTGPVGVKALGQEQYCHFTCAQRTATFAIARTVYGGFMMGAGGSMLLGSHVLPAIGYGLASGYGFTAAWSLMQYGDPRFHNQRFPLVLTGLGGLRMTMYSLTTEELVHDLEQM